MAVEVEISLEEAARGAQRRGGLRPGRRLRALRRQRRRAGHASPDLPRCEGAGRVRAVTRTAFGQLVREHVCDVCGGEGQVPSEPCRACGGRGRRALRKTLDVDVPAGIADEQRIRLSGRGHAGERGGPARRPLRAGARDRRRALPARRQRPRDAWSTCPRPPRRSARRSACPRSTATRRSRCRAGHAAGHGGHAARPRHAHDRPARPRRPAGGAQRGDPAQPDRAPARAARASCATRSARRTCASRATSRCCRKLRRALR